MGRVRSAIVRSRYLVVYDYGTGGVWAYVTAPSEDAILQAFPELQVVRERPEWMDDDARERLEDLDLEQPSGLLADLLAERG